MLNQFEFSLPEAIEDAVKQEFDDWKNTDKIGRVWNKDASVWSNDDENKWLGWLEIVETEIGNLESYNAFAEDVLNEGFTDIVLCGMGGSSLCPEVMAKTFNFEGFHVLDSTVPAQIKTLEANINIEKSLFIVSSKSGSTLETNIFRQLFFHKLAEKVGKENAGKHFVAVTDPNSKLQKISEENNFRKTFFGEPTVGGRFSALTAFGIAPAAAMQLDVEAILNNAMEMVHACKSHLPAENPGAVLGTILGVCQKMGRDKLTIFASPEIYDLGAWLEQLVAESTGKDDVSIIPIDRERIQDAENYDEDRVFVYLKLKGTNDDSLDERIASLKPYGHPFVTIEIYDKLHIGQEFFRWEFATAVAGSIMEINPFNQPDVEAAKIEARKITDKYEETGELPGEIPFIEEDGIKLFSSEAYVEFLNEQIPKEKTLEKYLSMHIQQLLEYDYFAILGFIEMNDENEKLLQELRHKILEKEKVATALGFGPRFLHSTGQAYKGGENSGVFLQITSDDEEDIAVPEQKYSFGVVKSAQSRGDFQVLLDRERRALRVHLGEDVKVGLEKIIELV